MPSRVCLALSWAARPTAAQHQFAAAEALADEIVGQSFELERHAGNGEGAKRLSGGPAHVERQAGAGGGGVLSLEEREFSGEARTQGAVFVGDAGFDGVGTAGFVGLQPGCDPGIVDRVVLLGTIVAAAFPADGASGFGRNGGG